MCDTQETKDFQKPADKLLEGKLPFSPHFLTPAGMLLPKHQQPPPMYGPRGATVPPKFIPKYAVDTRPPFRGRGGGTRGARPSQPRKQFNTEPTLPPRNWDLWCESCDRDFPSRDLLDKHKSEHITCGIDGCKFVGHPAVVQKHVTQQHESGLYEKLKNIETPEDIMKWREERKKKYPTRANIELKQKAKEARKERGEKLDATTGTKFSRKDQKEQQQQGKNKKNNRQKHKNKDRQREKQNDVQDVPLEVSTETEEVRQGIRPFRGTRGMWDSEETSVAIVEKEEVSDNPLLKLIGMYEDSADETEGEEEEDKEQNREAVLDISLSTSIKNTAGKSEAKSHEETGSPSDPVKIVPNCEENKDTTSDVKTTIQEGETPIQPETVQKKTPPLNGKRKHPSHEKDKNQSIKRKQLKTGLDYSSLRRHKPNTLLFKLLKNDIRHERNVMLQAVRFVVKNNFFDDKEKESEDV